MFENDYINVTQKISLCLLENPDALKALVLKCLGENPIGNFQRFYISELQKYNLLEANESVVPNVRQWIIAGSTYSATKIIFSNPKIAIRPLWIDRTILTSSAP